MTESSEHVDNHRIDWRISVLGSVLILGVAGALVAFTFFTEPTAKRGGATKKTAMLVDVVQVERGTYRPRIRTQGTVKPSRDIQLRPQVGGRIESVADEFTPGGDVEQGQKLVQIERADYEHVLARRKSELRQAKSELVVEKGRHAAAKAEYARVDEKLSADQKARVLRKPQLEAAKQRVKSARAAVEQARLDLQRTSVEAPFDARIVRRDVNLGSEVSPSDSLARLVGIDTYWVALEVPLSKLRWISVSSKDKNGAKVRIRNRQAWPEGTSRNGRLYKKVGVLDEDTRMARVLATVSDPLANDKTDKPPLIIGEFVEVTIRGKPLEGVARLNREYVRDRDTVWVMKDEKLQVKEVDVVLRDQKFAYISEGLPDGARVVTTNISTVVEGAPLQVRDPEKGGDSE